MQTKRSISYLGIVRILAEAHEVTMCLRKQKRKLGGVANAARPESVTDCTAIGIPKDGYVIRCTTRHLRRITNACDIGHNRLLFGAGRRDTGLRGRTRGHSHAKCEKWEQYGTNRCCSLPNETAAQQSGRALWRRESDRATCGRSAAAAG